MMGTFIRGAIVGITSRPLILQSLSGGGLGHGKGTLSTEFHSPKVALKGEKCAFVTCGEQITAVISGKNQAWIFGQFMNKGSDGFPFPIEYFPDLQTTHVAVGYSVILFGINQTQVWSWGENADGALGASKVKVLKEPTKILDFEENAKEEERSSKILQLDVSKSEHHIHCFVLSDNGKVFAFGSNYKGKLGSGDTDDVFVPTLISSLKDQHIVQVSCGGIHSAVINDQGKLLTFGCGSDGRLGHPESIGHRYLYKEYEPRIVETLSNVSQISLHYYHCIALTSTPS